MAKEKSTKIQREPTVWENIFANDTSDKGKIYLKLHQTLAGVVQWIGCQPANQRVTISIPCQGTCLGCRPGP